MDTKLDTLTQDKARLVEEKEALATEKERIEKDPDKFITERISHIDTFLNSPHIYKGNPKNPKNITMYQHLQNTKSTIKSNPQAEINKRLSQLNEHILEKAVELEIIETEITKLGDNK